MNDFLVQIADIFDEDPIESIQPETYFRELNSWSSLSALAIILLADESYNATISAQDISQVETLADLHQLFLNKAQ